MTVTIFPKDRKDLELTIWDGTELDKYLRPFMDLSMWRFDGSYMGVYDGDFEISPDNIRGLRLIADLIGHCIMNWEVFLKINSENITKEEVAEFNNKLKVILEYCHINSVTLVHSAD